jgi:hypothetical protein
LINAETGEIVYLRAKGWFHPTLFYLDAVRLKYLLTFSKKYVIIQLH